MFAALLVLAGVLLAPQPAPQQSGVAQQIQELEQEVNAAYAAMIPNCFHSMRLM